MTLSFAVYGEPGEVAAYRKMAAAYMRQKPNVTIKVEASGDPVTAKVRLNGHFADGTAPDVFLTDSTALPSLVSQKQVQPVDQLLEARGVQFGDAYERLGLEAFAADSALQCMPDDVSPYLIFYNKRLLNPASLAAKGEDPPTAETGWTWDEFATAARRMSRNGVKGMYLPADLTTLTPLLRSAGADIVDDPKNPKTLTLSDGATRTALTQILTVARNARLTPTPAELVKESAVSRFEHDRLGMLVGTRALVPRLRADPDLRFDVFPLPSLGRPQTIADVTGYCISRDSRHVEDAADFLAFASGKKGAVLTARSGGIVPANLAALHSVAFEQRGQFPLNVDVFGDVMRRADVMPDPPSWPQVVRATQPLVRRLFYAPVLNLDTLLPRIDALSASLLNPPTPTESPSESPTESPSG
ncbi:MAG: multiple sugar transport system substrate-binding protein [Nocardioidaceae bacterium]|nr:multiple sugar transport system substrate-binding protein [Nocardioidaceae bacterium]